MRVKAILSALILTLLSCIGTVYPKAADTHEFRPFKIAIVGAEKQIYTINSDGTQRKELTSGKKYPATYLSWSPDGQTILFCACDDEIEGELNVPFYLMDQDGKNIRQIDVTPSRSYPPFWSPDGNHIAFMNATKTEGMLYIIRKDGTGKRLLASVGHTFGPIQWSPDNKFIGYVEEVAERYSLYIVDMQGNQSGPLVQGITWFAWSPDGEKIAWWDIFAPNSDPRKTKLYNLGTKVVTEIGYGHDDGGTWLSDNNHLLIESQGNLYQNFFSVDVGTGELKRLTPDDTTADWAMTISADETKISFLTFDATNSRYHVAIANIDGTNRIKLAEIDSFYTVWSLWSPDSKQVVFTTGNANWLSVNVVSIDKKFRYTLGKSLTAYTFAWQPVKVKTN